MGLFGKSKIEIKLEEFEERLSKFESNLNKVVELMANVNNNVEELKQIDTETLSQATIKSTQAAYNGIRASLDTHVRELKDFIRESLNKESKPEHVELSEEQKIELEARRNRVFHKNINDVVQKESSEGDSDE